MKKSILLVALALLAACSKNALPIGGEDSGLSDSGMADSGMADSGMADSGSADSGMADGGMADGGSGDGGVVASGGTNTTYSGGTGAGPITGPATGPVAQPQPANIPLGTILFVTAVPNYGFGTDSSNFSNAQGDITSAPRGGDLYLRYPDGTLRNLTQEAGYGQAGMQGDKAIAVRDPSVHFSATKAVFAMVVGAPAQQFAVTPFYWQLYEVTGLGQGQTAQITKVANQPQNVNNISPIYGTDGRIIFSSTLVPFGVTSGARLDEYEKAISATGLWTLEPASGDLKILFNTPSGAFSPMLDSFGRVLWTNWDHMQRDQQADTKSVIETYNPVDCSDENDDATCVPIAAPSTEGVQPQSKEVFPEPRNPNSPNTSGLAGHGFNQFFPWMINEDGTEAETLNHVGVEEFGGVYNDGSFVNDPSLIDIVTVELDTSLHKNSLFLRGQAGFFRMIEDPNKAGRYYWCFSPEFHTMSSGDLGYFDADPSVNPEDMKIVLLTNTGVFPGNEDATRDGHYRDILPLGDGTLLGVYTSELQGDSGAKFTAASNAQQQALANHQPYGGPAQVATLYDYRIHKLVAGAGGFMTAGPALTAAPIHKDLTWYDPDNLVTFSGNLWELQPVEVRAKTIPARRVPATLPATGSVLTAEGIDVQKLRDWMVKNNLALITSYNVTQRDRADKLQPYNLEVKDAVTGAIGAKSIANAGKLYDVSYFELVEGDALRAYAGYGPNEPVGPGRRIIGQFLQDTRTTPWLAQAIAPQGVTTPQGSVKVSADGSIAAFVPAQKPISWQLTDASGTGVVRERDWLSFAAGEIRTCQACHGVNKESQTGAPPPTNEPQALHELLQRWKAANP